MNPLKHYRQQLGYTQERMAQALGITLRTYTRQELKGGSAPLVKLAQLLAAAPDRQTDDLQPLSLCG